jgi:uncharacterized membrane protein
LAFKDQLEAEVRRWQAEGLIDERTGASLLASSAAATTADGRPRFDLPGTLALLGALLVGAAVLSFVAAEWNELSRLSRMGILVAIVWGGLVAGAWRLGRNDRVFGHALALVGMAGFGGLIVATGQLYNLSGPPQTALGLWAAGALAGALLLLSGPLATLAAVLAGAMVLLADSWDSAAGWWVVPAAVAILAGAWVAARRTASSLARHAVALVVPVVIGRTCAEAGVGDAMGAVIAGVGLAIYWPATRLPALTARFTGFGPELAVYGVLMGGAGLILLRLMTGQSGADGTGASWLPGLVWSVLALALSVGALLDRGGSRLAVRVAAYSVFAVAVATLAFDTGLGMALGPTGVFALCGILVLAVAGLAVRIEGRSRKAGPGGPP